MLVHRSYEKELLDRDDIPFEDIKQNMKELDFINTWLGGHEITVNAFKRLVADKKQITICEIGCGGGDNLVAINKWCNSRKIELRIMGIDIKQECVDYAKSRTSFAGQAEWITSDYQLVQLDHKPDIIFSSLFCHHFTHEQLLIQLQWMKDNSQIGFFINDLQRNIVAFHAIRLLTQAFSKSYLVKNDAPLSVARGFKKSELTQLCDQCNMPDATIDWKWAFRYLVVYKHEPGRAI